ncbi:MAG: ABC transporter permease [Eubacteriales bacterium]|nr:ABC transporter permease [Eubacteriales bacterium]
MGKNKMKVNKKYHLLVGGILSFLVLSLCLVSFFYTPYPPNEMNLSDKFISPGDSGKYLLGTDHFGRDILSRIMYGSQSIVIVCLLAVAIGALVGSVLGGVSGIFKGRISSLIMRGIDGLMAFPGILLAMMMVVVVGKGKEGAIVAISIFMVPSFARLVYSLILDSESNLFIKAAKSYGITRRRLLVKHYLPIILPRLITLFTACLGAAIMIETSLSFLGLGVQPPNASWGMMLNEARQNFLQYPYLAIPSGIAISLSVLGFNLLGDGLNELFTKRRS